MKYCVTAALQFSLPTLRSQMTQAIKDKIAWAIVDNIITVAKPHWGEVTLVEGTDEDGKPVINHTIRFDNKADMDELFALIKGKIDKIPVLKGRVSKHICHHDIGGRSCEPPQTFVKE